MPSLYVVASNVRLRTAVQAIPSVEKIFSSIFVLLLLLALLLTTAFAQQFAALRLTVEDPQRSAIAQAKISVRNVETAVAARKRPYPRIGS